MAEFTGSGLYLSFGGVVYSADYRSLDLDESVDLIDASAGGDTWRPKLSTLRDGSFSFEYLSQTDGTAAWQGVAPNSEGTLEWAPEGTAAGKQKFTVNAVIKGRKRKIPYADIVVVTVEGEYNDASGPVESVYPA